MKDTLVLYHKNCSDGFGAAWAAWKKLGNGADYLPVQHQYPPPEAARGRTVYLLDFCYDETTTKELIARNARVVIIDHHAMREPAIRLAAEHVFDNGHSGAVLAWRYFHPDAPPPRLLLYVEDQDLWRFAMAETKALNEYMELLPFDFEAWNTLAHDAESAEGMRAICEKGALLLQFQMQKVDRLAAENAQTVLFEGIKTRAVNSPNFRNYLGHALYSAFPPIAIVWDEHADKIVVSLRSNGTINVAELAKRYGGGGHKAAAGFSLPLGTEKPWKILS
jgi:oligoribonuclease NrnB/cAMP/cGMP phosphodiesterase (DHH superfamily)